MARAAEAKTEPEQGDRHRETDPEPDELTGAGRLDEVIEERPRRVRDDRYSAGAEPRLPGCDLDSPLEAGPDLFGGLTLRAVYIRHHTLSIGGWITRL